MGDSSFAVGIDLLHGRSKHGIGSRRAGQLAIGLQAAGIAFEVFTCSELERIHKDAHHHLRSPPPPWSGCPLDQLQVPAMEGPHGGHEVQTPGGK